MRTKEHIIKRIKEDIEELEKTSNEKHELIFLNDIRTMLRFLE
jgi:hypothetical protein